MFIAALLQERKVLTVQKLDGRVGGGVKPDRLGNGRPGRDGGEPAASAHGEEQADKLYLPAISERRRWDREPGGNRGVPQPGEEGREDAVEQSGRSLVREPGASRISNPARRPRARSSRTTSSTAINASDGMGTGSAAAAGEVEKPWAGSWPGLGPEAFDLNAGAEELDFKGGGGAGLLAILCDIWE